MLAEAARLDRYLADLLALARLEADDFTLDRREVELAAVVIDTVEAWADRAARGGVRVASDVAAASVRTDPVRVRQVLDALVDNAVRVCGPGDTVTLTCAATSSGGVRLEVRDTGPGLTAEDAPVAFEPGVLHARYAGRRPGGHGLGLAIVGRLVTRLGGTVRAAPGAGGGTDFVIELP
jgi:two-component system sensor histidine kinase BaeS